MRARVSDVAPTVWVDGIIAGLVVAAVSAAVVFQQVLDTIGGRPISVATNLAYPLGDLLLLAFVVSVFSVRRWRPDRTWALIGAGIVSFWIADSLYLIETAQNTYSVGGVFDIGWWLGTVLIARAAWTSPARFSSEDLRESTPSIVMPIVFAMAGLTLLVVATLRPVNPLAVGLATASLVGVIVRLIVTFRQNVAMLRASRAEALTDALTGLGNRRKLMLALARRDALGPDQSPVDLVLFDLDGFKLYNDTFGHPAGDAMLTRLARHFETAVVPYGDAYRMGGDEFCALIGPGERKLESVVAAAAEALSDQGEGFILGCSQGAVHLPSEATSASEALRLADVRLYRDKDHRRSSPQEQARSALLQVLHERHPDLHLHLSEVAVLARSVGQRLGVAPETLDEVVRAAELHDVGKMAIPDTILNKPTQLNAEEWAFMRSHTLVGERILAAAKALVPVSQLVRSSHERMDGAGYPDGLVGERIPLGSRIIFACDAYNAITSKRPYADALGSDEALAELRACAGSQFDPAVVDALCWVIADSGTRLPATPAPSHA
jgi:diguanylate cyclase (GGDEF)-like protein